jgi:hypothetical protein
MVCIGADRGTQKELFLIDAYAKAQLAAEDFRSALHRPRQGDAAALAGELSALGLQEKSFYHG